MKFNEVSKWIVAVFCIGLLFTVLSETVCGQDVQYGVLKQKPIVNLPQDHGKWYVSIVGESTNPQYQQIAGWFQTNQDLKNLRYQTHYNEVLTNTATFKERYQPNVKGLPTVRIQDDESRVVYEAHGDTIPYSEEGLYAAIAKSVAKARGTSLRTWPCPCPKPKPKPDPVPDVDPELPPLDDGGAPDVTPPSPLRSILQTGAGVLVIADFIVSFLIGFAISWYRQYNSVKRG